MNHKFKIIQVLFFIFISLVDKKIKKEKDKNLKKSIKKILEKYNEVFLCAWFQTLNFKIWNQEHDENLCSRSSYIKIANNVNIYYENGDVYCGTLSKGIRNGFGIFKEFANGYIYNGNWVNDLVIILKIINITIFFLIRKMVVDHIHHLIINIFMMEIGRIIKNKDRGS